jgi:hypothetical protein
MTELRDDPQVRALYREAPGSFIAARDALVRARKDAGDDEGAAAIKRLRKPTVPAWALDQLADRYPDEIEALSDAGAELHAAQQAALSSTKHADRLRDATSARRAVVAALVAGARDILAEAGTAPDPHLEDVTATLEAASVNDEAAALLRSGTFDRPMRDAGGFGDIFGLQAVPDLEPDADERPSPSKGRAKARKNAAAAGPTRADLQAEANRLRRDLVAAERRAAKARETADRRAAEAEAMRGRLEVVEAKGRDDERAARAAEREAKAAAAAHERAVAALEAGDA